MPFYFRKSVSAGPFRFNFSKSGVGVSVGVKGLRIGTGPRGHYIHAGRGGLYYRATLGNAGKGRQAAVPRQQQGSPDFASHNSDVEMIEIDSGDVMHMRDASFSEVLDEINSKARQTRMSVALALAALILGGIAGLATGGPGLLLCALALPAAAIGSWLDSYHRTTVLYYDLEGDAETAYKRLTEGYDGLNGCAGKWHIEAGGAIQSLTAWKRNAGASHLVNRKTTTLTYALPPVIKSNLTPPALRVGRQIMFFMPDIVLVEDAGRVGAVSYADLNIRWQDSRFIETERVPSDARVVDHTWKHPNKSGGPDRRFKDNRQIPICLYETIHLTSSSGVNELLEFSRTGVASAFADGCRMLAALPRERKTALALPGTDTVDAAEDRSVRSPEGKGGVLKGALLVGVGLLVAFPAFKMISGSAKRDADPVTPPPLVRQISEPVEDTRQGESSSNTPDISPREPTPAVEAKPIEPVSVENDSPPQTNTRHTKTNANLRKGPGTTFAVLTVVPNGSKVTILESRGAWSRVQVDVDSSGWMANSTLEEERD